MAASRTGGARTRASSAASLGTGRTSARRPATRRPAGRGAKTRASSAASLGTGRTSARPAGNRLHHRRSRRPHCRHSHRRNRRHSHRPHHHCSCHSHRQPQNVTVPPALAELPRLLQARPLQVGRCRRWLRPPCPSVSSSRSSHDGASTATTASRSKSSCSSFMTPRCRQAQGLLPRRHHRCWRHLLPL